MKNSLNKRIWVLGLLMFTFGQFPLSAQEEQAPDSSQSLKKENATLDFIYGKQIQKTVISSVSTVLSNDLTNSTSVGNALSGRLAGLTVIQQSGEPGADYASLFIRGRNTYNSNSPLLLVDGFESDFQQLALFEIESISILKDAAAMAMYGQKGANGAVVITTKRGTEGKTRINFNFNGGVQSPQYIPEMLSSFDYATLYNEALQNDGLPALYSADALDHLKKGDDPYVYPDNNFFDQLLKKNSKILQGDLGISGGTKNVKYFVSLNYLRNEGIYKYESENEGYKTQAMANRYNLRTNLDIAITKNLSGKIDIGGRLEDRKYPGSSTSEIWNAMYNTPPSVYPMLNPNGSIGGTQQYTSNPYGLITSRGYQSSSEKNLNASVRLRYDLSNAIDGLSIGVSGAVNNWMNSIDNKSRSFAVYSLQKSDDSYSYTKIGENSELSWVTGSGHRNRSTFESDIKYEKVTGNHSISGMILYHMDSYIIRGSHVKQNSLGGSGRLFYGYKGRYLAELTSGYYGSELFMEGKRFGLFPAAALGWVISEENFIRNSLKFIDYLKIRGSYGITGSKTSFTGLSVADRIFYNQYYSGAPQYNFGPSLTTVREGRQEGRLANPDITWDKCYKTDLSAEMRLFNHIEFMFTYYTEKRSGILAQDGNLPGTLGFNNGRQPWRNVGETENHGFETTLGIHGNVSHFQYSLFAGAWYNKSKQTKRPDLTVYPDEYRNAAGKPIGQIFGLEAIGYYKDAADVSNYPTQMFGIVGRGDVIYKDVNDDKVVNDNDMKPIGYTDIPEYTYNFGGDFKYRNFDLSFLFQGTAHSSTVLSGYFIPFNNEGNAFTYAFNRWTPENPAASLPRLSTTANANNYRSSTLWLRSTDYLKLRSLEIGYQLPESAKSKMKISGMRIFVRGLNLFTYSKDIDFVDPENMSGYPSMKSINMGVNISL